ncbi:MAG: hypothetical protein QGG02_13640 [Gammaproteobacteria bacterium]|nr:hypothetical protein [Gammaproteobacteria bacterium]MDP6732662.1 hypothetical protein [Gammaproteobacteria bacterium]
MNSKITRDQLELARSIGIGADRQVDLEQLIREIEQELGQDTLLEQSRWFVMSVLRYCSKADWQDIDQSNVSEQQQYELAASYIARDDLKRSLRTVLKDARCRFTLIGFAKSRSVKRRVLSTTTKAFKQAKQLLQEVGLLEVHMRGRSKRPAADTGAKLVAKQHTTGSEINQDAAQAGYFDDSAMDTVDALKIGSSEPAMSKLDKLSEEEYAELESAILVREGEMSQQQSQTYSGNENRQSLLMGFTTGCVMLAIVLWLLF